MNTLNYSHIPEFEETTLVLSTLSCNDLWTPVNAGTIKHYIDSTADQINFEFERVQKSVVIYAGNLGLDWFLETSFDKLHFTVPAIVFITGHVNNVDSLANIIFSAITQDSNTKFLILVDNTDSNLQELSKFMRKHKYNVTETILINPTTEERELVTGIMLHRAYREKNIQYDRFLATSINEYIDRWYHYKTYISKKAASFILTITFIELIIAGAMYSSGMPGWGFFLWFITVLVRIMFPVILHTARISFLNYVY